MSDENTVLVNDLYRLIKKYQAIRNIVRTLVVSIFIYKVLKNRIQRFDIGVCRTFPTSFKIGFAKNHCQTIRRRNHLSEAVNIYLLVLFGNGSQVPPPLLPPYLESF